MHQIQFQGVQEQDCLYIGTVPWFIGGARSRLQLNLHHLALNLWL